MLNDKISQVNLKLKMVWIKYKCLQKVSGHFICLNVIALDNKNTKRVKIKNTGLKSKTYTVQSEQMTAFVFWMSFVMCDFWMSNHFKINEHFLHKFPL